MFQHGTGGWRGGHNHTPSSAPTRHPVPMGSAMLSQNGVMEGGSECRRPSRGSSRPIPPSPPPKKKPEGVQEAKQGP